MVHDVEIQAFAARADPLHLLAGVDEDPAGGFRPRPGRVHGPGAELFFVFFETHLPRRGPAQLIQQGLGIVDAVGAAAPTAGEGEDKGHGSIVAYENTMSADPALSFAGVTKRFPTADGGTYTAISDIDLLIGDGEFVSIVGPTGCGKSTLLNIAAGLLHPDAGSVHVFGRPLVRLNPHATYQFQQDVLLPWKTAEENVMLGLLFRQVPASTARPRAREIVARVGLAGFEDRYPHQLSGGMRKRVALAQTLIVNPQILLMDEPFSALDAQTRQIMENDLLSIWAEFRKTVLFVTHDLEEAIALADRVIVLSSGPAARIIDQYPVPLPRPRDVADVRVDRAFLDIHRTIWEHLSVEVRKAYAHTRAR